MALARTILFVILALVVGAIGYQIGVSQNLAALPAASGAPVAYCPFIFVDQDVSLLRGLLQGWPKKMGSTWLTRSLPLDHPAAAPLRAGTRLGASLAVKDRRLIEARLTLTSRPGEALGFAARPTYGTVGWADLTRPAQTPRLRFLRPLVSERVGGVNTIQTGR